MEFSECYLLKISVKNEEKESEISAESPFSKMNMQGCFIQGICVPYERMREYSASSIKIRELASFQLNWTAVLFRYFFLFLASFLNQFGQLSIIYSFPIFLIPLTYEINPFRPLIYCSLTPSKLFQNLPSAKRKIP